MKRYGKKVSIAWEVEGFEATRRVVLRENCLRVASARLVLEDILDGTVWAFRSPHAEWDRTFQLVYHKNKLVGELLSAFFSVAKEVGAQGIPAGIPMGGIVAEEERLDADHNGGIDFCTAPVAERERFAFTEAKAREFSKELRRSGMAAGCVVLSTCNRTELWLSGYRGPGGTIRAGRRVEGVFYQAVR